MENQEVVVNNKKTGNGLVVFLIILVLALLTCVILLGTGVVKSPFVKESTSKTSKTTTVTKDDTKKSDTKIAEIKDTRYYQFVSALSQQKDSNGTPEYMTTEIELNPDGTARIAYANMNDADDKKGIYVEDDKYIILELNNPREACTDDSYRAEIADSCTDNIILIKDGETLKTQRGALLHFEIDNVNNTTEFVKVDKEKLVTSIKE